MQLVTVAGNNINTHKNISKMNTDPNQYQQNKVEAIKKGELVKRLPTAKTTYLRGDFCRSNNKYELTAYDDISRTIYVKKGTILFETWDTTDEKEFYLKKK